MTLLSKYNDSGVATTIFGTNLQATPRFEVLINQDLNVGYSQVDAPLIPFDEWFFYAVDIVQTHDIFTGIGVIVNYAVSSIQTAEQPGFLVDSGDVSQFVVGHAIDSAS